MAGNKPNYLKMFDFLSFSGDCMPSGSGSQSSLMSDVNYNGLAYFAISNLLTGLINKSVQTIYASSALSLFIITSYMLTLSILMKFLFVKKIRLKF